MFVQQLSLRDYRNYETADVTFSPGTTIVLGPNGQGKTNLVESLVVLAHGGSHRIHQRDALIRQTRDTAVIRARLVNASRSVTTDVEINRVERDRVQLNGNPSRLSDIADYLALVLFAPEDIMLIRGEPALRRQYLDDIAAWFSPRLRGVFADYDRTLKQRNTLLKSLASHRSKVVDLSTLDVWDASLVELGADIHEGRVTVIERLLPHLQSRYATIVGADHQPIIALDSSVLREERAGGGAGGGEGPASDNRPAGTFSDICGERLNETRQTDIDRGQTTVGPHRDDMIIQVNGLPAKGYASHGESWSLVLALRLAELDIKREHGSHGDPIVILDDVYAELDQNRRLRLDASLRDVEQVIITAAVADDVPESPHATIVHVERGAIIDEPA